jgi:inositol oxygenase
MQTHGKTEPLQSLDQWDDFVESRYREGKSNDEFRQYVPEANPGVAEFYRQNHAGQTVAFVRAKRDEYLKLAKGKKSIWEAAEFLNTLVDDSEPQWAVVGDTFPVGCAWSDQIVYHEYFAANPDRNVPEYQTECGIYERHCGLDKVHLSWGHDEYIYWVTRNLMPEEAQYMLRYHSFYPAHKHGAYRHLMNDRDERMFEWVRKFNQYDLYSKGTARPDVDELRPYYEDLVAEFFPDKIDW